MFSFFRKTGIVYTGRSLLREWPLGSMRSIDNPASMQQQLIHPSEWSLQVMNWLVAFEVKFLLFYEKYRCNGLFWFSLEMMKWSSFIRAKGIHTSISRCGFWLFFLRSAVNKSRWNSLERLLKPLELCRIHLQVMALMGLNRLAGSTDSLHCRVISPGYFHIRQTTFCLTNYF